MGRRLMGRIRLLRDLVLEARGEVGCWAGRSGVGGIWLEEVAAETGRRF